ncbi:MAG: phasin family protein [Gammaproteobacteria bacterium]
MQTEIFSKWQSYGKDALTAMTELQAIGTKAFEQLAAHQIDFVNTCVDAGVKQMGLLSEPKSLKDIIATQTEFASENTQRMVSGMRKTNDILNGVRAELTGWCETKFNDAAKSIVKETSTKKAA